MRVKIPEVGSLAYWPDTGIAKFGIVLKVFYDEFDEMCVRIEWKYNNNTETFTSVDTLRYCDGDDYIIFDNDHSEKNKLLLGLIYDK